MPPLLTGQKHGLEETPEPFIFEDSRVPEGKEGDFPKRGGGRGYEWRLGGERLGGGPWPAEIHNPGIEEPRGCGERPGWECPLWRKVQTTGSREADDQAEACCV